MCRSAYTRTHRARLNCPSSGGLGPEAFGTFIHCSHDKSRSYLFRIKFYCFRTGGQIATIGTRGPGGPEMARQVYECVLMYSHGQIESPRQWRPRP